jgi:hypothetical protein
MSARLRSGRTGGDRVDFGRGRLAGVGLAALLATGTVAAAVPGAGSPAGSSGRQAPADDGFRCELKEARGVPAPDAETATDLLCAELRKVSGDQGVYSVRLRTLGEVVVLTVDRADPAGSVTVQVRGVEEVVTAAPRVADALVRGLGFATTQRVDNLLAEETREPRVKKGSVKFSLGIADVESPGFGARAAGFSLGLMYSTPRFALPAELRFAWDGDDPAQSMDLFSASVGGRAYLSRKNVSPFVGGGLGVLNLSANEGGWDGGDFFYAEKFGVAPYLEAGVEVLAF